MVIRLLRYLGLAAGLALAVSACGGVNPPQRLPQLTFSNETPFRLNVGRVEVVSNYQAPARPPHIEYDMPTSPETAIKRWVQDRLQPTGREGTLRVLIRDAAATETPLNMDTGVSAMFKKQQSARVDMSIDVALQMLDDRQFVIAEVTGKAARSRTEPEEQTLSERDKLLFDMVSDLMHSFDHDIQPDIQSTFGKWLGTT
jgi:hypothetical protein